MRERGATTVRMVGHGSSDNAASYGVYAFGLLPHWTALRDSISLTVYYGAELDMSGCTALALSQSGRTPDVVEYSQHARRRGAFTVAITNDPESELAAIADAVLHSRQGRSAPSPRRRRTRTRSRRSASSPRTRPATGRDSPTSCARSPSQLAELIPRDRGADHEPSRFRSRMPAACSSSGEAPSSRPHARSRSSSSRRAASPRSR